MVGSEWRSKPCRTRTAQKWGKLSIRNYELGIMAIAAKGLYRYLLSLLDPYTKQLATSSKGN